MKDIAVGIHLVKVSMPLTADGRAEFQLWVAAVPRDQAADAVAKAVPSDRTVELTSEPISRENAARLNLRPGDVKEYSIASEQA